MKLIKGILLLLLVISLTACNQTNSPDQNEGNKQVFTDGPARLVVNGAEYVSVSDAEDSEFTIDEMIGKVETKVLPDVVMKYNFSSNSLEKGTEIYSVKEDDDILLARISENKYSLYTKEE